MQYYGIGALVLVMLALGAGVAYLAMLLVQTSSELDTTTAALAEQEASNSVLEQTNRVLLTDRARLDVYLEAATERYTELSSENVSLRSDLVTETDQYLRLDGELSDLLLRHAELVSAHDDLTDRHDTLASDYDDVAGQYKDLVERFAELERLQERLPELQKRIAALEAQLGR